MPQFWEVIPDAFWYFGYTNVIGIERFKVRAVLHDYLEGCISASIAKTVNKDLQVISDLLSDCFDAMVGDLHTIFDVKNFKSLALGCDVFECGVRDTATVTKAYVSDCICIAVVVDDADHMLVTQLLYVIEQVTEV